MEDLGAPIAFLALREGTPVYDHHHQRIGVVEEVLADYHAGIFEGVLIHTVPLPGRHLIADAHQVTALHERGVLLTHSKDGLRRPTTNTTRSEQPVERPLHAKLRRLWDRLSRRR